jgi:two-component system, cell cycle sensor histidine kinase and response regulator CckA
MPAPPTPPSADPALRDSIQFHRQIVQSTREGIVAFDRNLRVVVFNARLEALTGVPARDVMGVHPAECGGRFGVFPLPDLDAVLRGAVVSRAEVRIVRVDDERWVSDEYAPVRTPAGEVIGVVGTVADITERRLRAAELQASHARVTLALGAANMGVWEIDMATRRVRWSENMDALFGQRVPPGDHPLDAWLELIHPPDVPVVAAAIDEGIRARRPVTFEFRPRATTAPSRWLQGSASVHVGSAGDPCLRGATIDVTVRRQLEAQLRQAQKMEAVGTLAGGIAHDFNNLLTAILGYAQFLRADLVQPDQQQDLGEVIRAAERAAALTRQLLAFSRQQVVEAVLLDLNDVVAELTAMLRRLIGEHIDLTTVLSPVPAVVRADVGQIEQVVVNLVLNARDAMPNGGRVRVEVVQRETTGDEIGERVALPTGVWHVITVSDTGIGMTEEVQARLFEPFFTTKERGKGTGLGLATVYGIVSQADGHVRVYSEPGYGATFRVYLPRAYGQAADAARVIPEPLEAGSGTILLVEDDLAVRRLTQTILERSGYTVHAAATPAEAAALFPAIAGEVVLLLTDVMMPGGSGPELYEQLRGYAPSLRVVFMSGYAAETAFDQRMLAAGLTFLQKPFAASALLAKLRQVLGH